MPRVLVRSNDRRVVLEAHDVKQADITADESPRGCLNRLQRVVREADCDRTSKKRMPERLPVIVPARGYLDVSG
jgi:hypothetical protein